MDGASWLDYGCGIDCVGGKASCRGGGGNAGGGFAGCTFPDDCAVLDFVQQAVDGATLGYCGDGVWVVAGNAYAHSVGAGAVRDASGDGCVVKGLVGAGGEWSALHGNDYAALELGNDAGSGFAGGRAVKYGATDWEFAG